MLKPLELTTYPKTCTCHFEEATEESPAGVTHVPLSCLTHGARVTVFAKRKRLTGPELAAEYWRAEADLGIGRAHARFGYFKKPEEAQWEADLLLHSQDELERRYEALARFASLPHYDEDVTP